MKTTPRRGLLMLLSALLLSLPVLVLAAPGDLDPSFDGDGKVLTDFRGFDFATALVVQPDGKLVAAGRDVRDNFGGGFGTLFALVLQPDGKLVVAGDGGQSPLLDVFLARLNPNGSLDTSFGAGGIVQTDLDPSGDARALVLQPDGKLVVAGSLSGPIGVDLIFARYHPDGSLDASFGAGGIVVVENSGFFEALLLQPDGKLSRGSYSSRGSWWAAVPFQPRRDARYELR